MGIREPITSPTFNIIQEYAFGHGTLYHIDLYRINNIHDLHSLGIEDNIDDQNAITVIEWPEIILPMLCIKIVHIRIDILDKDRRNIEITSNYGHFPKWSDY